MRSRRTTSSSVVAAALAVAMTVAVVGVTVPVAAFGAPSVEGSRMLRPPKPAMRVRLLADGLQGTLGATIGPDGALYVAEAALGQITRIDPWDGTASSFASGLPTRVIALGGATDLAFVGDSLYVLVTLVGPDVGGTSVDGIYQMDASGEFTVFADLGAWSIANPPATQFDVPSGLQFALQPVADGFLVSDGHHNRVLHVSTAGEITQRIQFENVVPTGLAVAYGRVFVAQAGPVPHDPSTGKVVAFRLHASRPRAHEVAAGYSLLVDVERGPRGALYALSQGDSPGDVPPGSPAEPDSGRLLLIRSNGSFSVLVDKLDLPSSLDFVGHTAFVTTLNGEIWKITNVGRTGTH